MNVGIFGLGYVGVVNAVCFAKLGHNVLGCDIKQFKVDSLNKAISPITEPMVNELLTEAIKNKSIRATTDVNEMIKNCDILLICVGTPSNSEGEVNLDYIFNTTDEIAGYLSSTSKKISVVYRSTIPPGTLENFIRPIFKNKLTPNWKGEVKLAFYPEFLREGKAVKDFFEAPRIVIGSNEQNIEEIETLLNYSDNIPVFKTDSLTSEFIKYVDNSFHALKVAYVNEVYQIGKNLGVDVQTANKIFLADSSLNISPTYLKPGMPFGGSCLPKDLRAINAMSKKLDLKLPLLDNILASNHESLNRVGKLIRGFGKKKILFAGFTFKNYTDDYRESPVMFLIESLIKEKYNIKVFDEDINIVNLRIDKPSLSKLFVDNLSNASEQADLIVVTKRYMPQLISIGLKDKILLNATGIKYDGSEIVNLY